VAGGIIAVLPGQLGIGVFSPPLDARGNSVRGIRVCDAISRHCDLHLFNRPGIGKSAIRLKFIGAELSSNRIRPPQQSQMLRLSGSRIQAYQLQGNLTFATTESVVREVFVGLDESDYILFDFKRVLSANESACRLFYQVLVKFNRAGKSVLFTHVEHVPVLRRYMKARLGAQYEEMFRSLDDNDLALEWCENQLLSDSVPPAEIARGAAPGQYELCEGLAPAELETFVSFLKRRSYQPGESIINVGDQAREMYLLAHGQVSVLLRLENGASKRLATFSPGMSFGEMAMLDGSPRSASIFADTAVECDILDVGDFERLGQSYPGIKIKLLQNLTLSLCHRLRKANRELGLFH
jgi:glutaminase